IYFPSPTLFRSEGVRIGPLAGLRAERLEGVAVAQQGAEHGGVVAVASDQMGRRGSGLENGDPLHAASPVIHTSARAPGSPSWPATQPQISEAAAAAPAGGLSTTMAQPFIFIGLARGRSRASATSARLTPARSSRRRKPSKVSRSLSGVQTATVARGSARAIAAPVSAALR